MNIIGEYNCTACGRKPITDDMASKMRVIFPRGLEPPVVKIDCPCGLTITSYVTWEDAIIFDYAGANVDGYSFSRGQPPTEEEIKEFMNNFDMEVDAFLSRCDFTKPSNKWWRKK